MAVRRFLNREGSGHKKIFAIGFNKSGTTSLHVLFTSLGLRSYHGVEWRGCDDLELLQAYDCFSDDVPRDLAKLDRLFPGSHFILQVRDLDGWVYSRLAHIEREKAKNGISGPSWPEWDVTEQAIKAWIKKRNAYHLFVLSYFARRPADLVVVNFIRDENAATRVCNFLGYEGRYERPKENVNPLRDVPTKYIEMLRNCAVEMGIPEPELKYDIYCPSLVDGSAARFPADTSFF